MIANSKSRGALGRALASLRARPVDGAFVALVVVGCLTIFYLGRLSTFRGDDWVFIAQRSNLPLDYLFVPHNEHWSFFMKLVFQALFSVVGMHSYLPYLAVLVLAYGAAVLAVYAAVSAAGGRLLGFAVGMVMLFLGTAHEALFWYATIGLVLSLAAGAAATWLLLTGSPNRRTYIGIGGLLLLSVMNSGVGLAFVVAVGAAILADPARRPGWWAPVAAGAVYLVWHLIWGRVGAITVDSVLGVPAFVVTGAANGLALTMGIARDIGYVLAIMLIAACLASLASSRGPRPATIVGTLGLLAFLGIIALVRDLGPRGADGSLAPRYIPISAAFMAIAVAGLAGSPVDHTTARRRSLVIVPLTILALTANVTALIGAAETYGKDATEIRAMLVVLERDSDAPAIRASAPLGMTPAMLGTLLTAYGSPTRDTIRPTVVLPIKEDALDRALFTLVRDGLSVAPEARVGAAPGSTRAPPSVVDWFEVAIEASAGCQLVEALGPDSQVAVSIPSGSSLRLTTEGWGDLGVFLAYDDEAFQEAAAMHQTILAATPYRITVPDMGAGFMWRLNLKLGAGIRSASVCMRETPIVP